MKTIIIFLISILFATSTFANGITVIPSSSAKDVSNPPKIYMTTRCVEHYTFVVTVTNHGDVIDTNTVQLFERVGARSLPKKCLK